MGSRWQYLTEQRLAIALGGLLALDLVTKALAKRLLEPGVALGNAAFVELTLSVNSTGFGVWAASVFHGLPGGTLVAIAVGQLVFATYLVRMQRLRPSWIWTLFSGIAVFGVLAGAGICLDIGYAWAVGGAGLYYAGLKRTVPDLVRRVLAGHGVNIVISILVDLVFKHSVGDVSRLTGATLARGAVTVVFLTMLWLLRRTVWRLPLLLMSSAGLGNALSSILPPHSIIDFIYSAPLSKYLGHGVMNLADFYYDAGLLSLLILLGRESWLRLRRGAPADAACG